MKHRTQMLFPKWLNIFLDFVSKKNGISKGEVIRRMLFCSITGTLFPLNQSEEDFEYEARKVADDIMET